MELKDIRASIDAIDDELVRLFARRMDCSGQLARAKQPTGKPIRDPAREREILAPLRERSDYVIDTTLLTTWDLKKRIRSIFGDSPAAGEMLVEIVSFGYKYGVPANADLMFDVRFLNNPYYVPELRGLTGNDKAVSSYIFSDPAAQEFLDKASDMLDFLIPLYRRESKQALVIAVGCTGGHHRSVTVANELTRLLSERGVNITLVHRDIGR